MSFKCRRRQSVSYVDFPLGCGNARSAPRTATRLSTRRVYGHCLNARIAAGIDPGTEHAKQRPRYRCADDRGFAGFVEIDRKTDGYQAECRRVRPRITDCRWTGAGHTDLHRPANAVGLVLSCPYRYRQSRLLRRIWVVGNQYVRFPAMTRLVLPIVCPRANLLRHASGGLPLPEVRHRR